MAASTPRGISYPTSDDKIKDGSNPSALADDFAVLASSADAAMTAGMQEAKDAAAADASAKDAAIDAKATSAVSTANNALAVSNGASSDAGNAMDRVTALESAAGFGPSTPTDGTMANYIASPESLTAGALSAAIVESVFDVGAPTGSIAGDTAAVVAACLNAKNAGRLTVSLGPGLYQLDGLDVAGIHGRYLIGDNATFTPNSWVYPFRTSEYANMSANRARSGRGRVAIEVDDALLSHWQQLFPVTKSLGITVGTAWHTNNGAKWIAEAYRHGWEVIHHLPEDITAVSYLQSGQLDQVVQDGLAKIKEQIGTDSGLGFVYPQHVRNLETDRVLSKYFTRGRGIGSSAIYQPGEGRAWLTSARFLDSEMAGNVMSADVRRNLETVATTGGDMVFYMHFNPTVAAERIAGLTDFVNICRTLGIEIVNPGVIWSERRVSPDPYIEVPTEWTTTSAVALSTDRSYHGGRSAKLTPNAAAVSGGSVRRTVPFIISTRAGMFGVYRASCRYSADGDIPLTAANNGIYFQTSPGRRTIQGEALTAGILTTSTPTFPDAGAVIPAANWARVSRLIYLDPSIALTTLGVGLQNFAPGSTPLYIDEIKLEHIDWVPSVSYRVTLAGTGNVVFYTGFPDIARHDVTVVPDTPTTGAISLTLGSSNAIVLKSSAAGDTMQVTVTVRPKGSSYDTLTLPATGA